MSDTEAIWYIVITFVFVAGFIFTPFYRLYNWWYNRRQLKKHLKWLKEERIRDAKRRLRLDELENRIRAAESSHPPDN